MPTIVLRLRPAIALAALATFLPCGRAAAQVGRPTVSTTLVLPGSVAEDRIRLGQLFGEGSTPDFLIRSASSLTPDGGNATRSGLSIIAPELDVVYNSALPYSMNDGALWAGRGLNAQITAGVTARWGPVSAIIAPQFWSADNRDFQTIMHLPAVADGRSVWSNPFHPWPSSLDLPYRFGNERLAAVDAGQSTLNVDVGRALLGAGTENVWWGPGAMNAIVLSNNAPGFPHLFARTRREGLRTRVGRFDAQWLLGSLRESDFFDTTRANDRRSLSGLVVVWTPSGDSGISVGAARTVWANDDSPFPAGAAFDFLRNVGAPNTDTAAKPAPGRADQIFSLFGRWVFPGAGFEAYAEWARFELPASLRDLIEYPQHSQAYTAGLQWARPVRVMGAAARVRLVAEGTYLEPDPSQRVRPVGTTYASRVVPQGYTNRGQSLGAAIGPGSSSQWLSLDLFAARYTLGAYFYRIRFDNATLWTSMIPEPKSEDLSLISGLRASVIWRGAQLAVDFAHNVRLDYLFQDRPNPTDPYHKGVDIGNNTLAVKLSTAVMR